MKQEQTKLTILDELKRISVSSSSNETDEKICLYVGRVAFPKVVITYGIVYPFGKGPTMSIQQFAEIIIKAYENRSK